MPKFAVAAGTMRRSNAWRCPTEVAFGFAFHAFRFSRTRSLMPSNSTTSPDRIFFRFRVSTTPLTRTNPSAITCFASPPLCAKFSILRILYNSIGSRSISITRACSFIISPVRNVRFLVACIQGQIKAYHINITKQ